MAQVKVMPKSNHTLSEMWAMACAWDHIEPGSKFVVWSPKNPWARKYNDEMNAVLAARDRQRLSLMRGTNHVHYVQFGQTLCGRRNFWRPLQPTTQKYADCPGCTIAVQRVYAGEE